LIFVFLFTFSFILFGCVLSQEENREKVQKGDYDVFNLVGLKFSLRLTLCAMLLDVILVVFC
jgi:hypothetical protein